MNCVRLSRGSSRDLESFQKRALSWVCYESNRSYLQQLRLLNVLPLPHFKQCNDILLMSKLLVEGEHNINISNCNPESGRSTMFFKLNKCKKAKNRGEFVYRTCRIIKNKRKNPVCQSSRSKIANSQPDVEVCRQQILWFQPLHMTTMLRLLWLS